MTSRMSVTPIQSDAALPLTRAIHAAFAGPRFAIGRTYYADAAKAAQAASSQPAEPAAVSSARTAQSPRSTTRPEPRDTVELTSAPRPAANAPSSPRAVAAAPQASLDLYA